MDEPATSTPAAPPERPPPPPIESAALREPIIPSNPALPPDYGPSFAYAQSSQARNWRFSAKQIAQMRHEGNLAARKRLEKIWNEEKSGGASSSSSSSSATAAIPFLSVSDELALLTYYLIQVGRIVRAFGLPELIEATATTYVKRFYLRNTCMDFHPKSIVLTCIFLATKTENYPLSLSSFAKKLAGKEPKPEVIKENERTVLDLEFLVSQSLSFEYSAHGAHRALHGLLLDAQTLDSPPSREAVHALAASSQKNLSNSRLTDAEFIYTPTQIALACLRASEGAGVSGKDIVERWLDQKERSAREAQLRAKAAREKLRTDERERVARARIASARKARGKAGVKVVEDELAAAPAPAVVEFDDTLLDQQPLGMKRQEIHAVLDEIEKLFRDRETGGCTGLGKGDEDKAKVTEIDRRQKECMNPEKVPGSRLYLKRQAEEEAAAAQRRAKKAAAAAASANGEDPFGEVGKAEGGGGLFGAEMQKRAEQGGTAPPLPVDSDDDEVPVSKDFAVKPDAKV
ncbi:hypothetical protein ACQY0O_002260 [Thecaphora frezii]